MSEENQQPVEQQEQVEQQEEEYSPKDECEEKALKIGWKPTHQGDNYVDAREYVLRRPLFERIETQKQDIYKQRQEINELKDAVKQSLDHVVSMRKEAYEAAIKNIESAKLSAVEESNTVRYQELEKQSQELRQSQTVDPIINQPRKISIEPEVTDFATRNKEWYNNDTVENKKMVAAALALENFLVRQYQIDQGLSPNQLPVFDKVKHLQEIEKRIKDIPEFQHRFKKESTPMVGKSTTGSNSGLSGSNLVNKLSPQQLQFGKVFERTSNGKYTLEMYAKDLDKQGKLGK